MLHYLFTILLTLCSFVFSDPGISQADLYRKNSGLQWDLAMKALEDFSLEETDELLDVGCGDGKITNFISSQIKCGSVIGLDVSQKMLEQATSEFAHENLSFIHASATSIPFENRFDKVVSFSTLHWVLDQEAALQSIKNSLKGNGLVLLSFPQKSANNFGVLGEKLIRSEKWASHFPSFEQERIYYTPGEYRELVLKAGLEVISLTTFQGAAYYKNKEALVLFLTPVINFTRHLSQDLQKVFVEEMADEILQLEPPASDGTICIHFDTIRVVAKKTVHLESKESLCLSSWE